MKIVKIYPIKKKKLKKKKSKKKTVTSVHVANYKKFPFLEIAFSFFAGILFEKLLRPRIDNFNVPATPPQRESRKSYVV